MKRIVGILVMLAGFSAPSALRGDVGDVLIIAGGGFVGPWDTEIDMANISADPISVTLSRSGPIPMIEAPCPPNCNGKTYTVPGHGTLRVLASDFLAFTGPQMIRVETDKFVVDGPVHASPVVHARAVNTLSAAQFAELPVVRESTIKALDQVDPLVFPGASRLSGVYSNLILGNIEEFSPSSEILVEAFDSQGSVLGSAHFTAPTTFVDVVKALGVSELDGGQIRVTKLSGDGTLWGVLTTVVGNGSLKVSLGANP
ncbi:MAG: hypothetical protein ABI968_14630 [Acidobacteriota bacterium]